MKHSPFTRLVILFLVLWLPLQSATAMAAPFCEHMLQHGLTAQTAHEQASDRHDSHADGTSALAGQNSGCDDCGLCYFACTSFLSIDRAVSMPEAASAPVPASAHRFKFFSPQQPHRPPLASA